MPKIHNVNAEAGRMSTFLDWHADKIHGVLSCYDRIVIQGTLPDISHADAMAWYLHLRGIPIFDYTKWPENPAQLLDQ